VTRARKAVRSARIRARVGESDWKALQAAARAVLDRAHAPYSGLHVAAALLLPDGRIVTGVNVENASYGLTQCAERNALCAAVTLAGGPARALLLVSSAAAPITPCGACRQVLLELAPEAEVRCLGRDGRALRTRVGALLPGAFSARALPRTAR
jgi:homotetrameric cytidine deaminase